MSQSSKGSTKLMLTVWLIIMLFIGYKSFTSSSESHSGEIIQTDTATLDRIKPVGEVRVEDAVALNNTSERAERSAEELYTKCQSCHESGIMGAPKYGSLEDWTSIIEGGIDNAVQVAITGKGGMPPRGTCMDCTDNEIRLAIQYMMDSAK